MLEGGQQLPRAPIPEPRASVRARRQDPRSVGTEHRGIDSALMLEGGQQLSGAPIPEPRGFVLRKCPNIRLQMAFRCIPVSADVHEARRSPLLHSSTSGLRHGSIATHNISQRVLSKNGNNPENSVAASPYLPFPTPHLLSPLTPWPYCSRTP